MKIERRKRTKVPRRRSRRWLARRDMAEGRGGGKEEVTVDVGGLKVGGRGERTGRGRFRCQENWEEVSSPDGWEVCRPS